MTTITKTTEAPCTIMVDRFERQYIVSMIYADDSVEDDTRHDAPEHAEERAATLAQRHRCDWERNY